MARMTKNHSSDRKIAARKQAKHGKYGPITKYSAKSVYCGFSFDSGLAKLP